MFRQSEFDDNSINDMITLFGCGKTSQWRFPLKLKYCPAINCTKIFKSRSDAIVHYQQSHANNAVFCTICNQPVSASHKSLFIKHYTTNHPDVEFPLQEFDNKKVFKKNWILQHLRMHNGAMLIFRMVITKKI